MSAQVLRYGHLRDDRAVMFDLIRLLKLKATSEDGRVLDALAQANGTRAPRLYPRGRRGGRPGGRLVRHRELGARPSGTRPRAGPNRWV
ncbi:MAG: hypothetical protein ACRDUW_05365 [Pseudonocardiaceae bacterium]